jgi:hypothetical protein
MGWATFWAIFSTSHPDPNPGGGKTFLLLFLRLKFQAKECT